ncbi:uncharacterized protein LTR77_003300 [Saxophila tyrrhenica]|uniref:Uncharacterized protein n=1 Tax=Saxophila tyrrhenica TaxID=1690608 RepID=A0AAV9PLI4_9PEZI|nr:hypothetical protein LTR77_003300 [Saxophila tyrrhenica]
MAVTPTSPTILSLPRELRDQVYGYALLEPIVSVTPKLHHAPDFQNYPPATQPGITKTNRQLREETLPLFYSLNTFHMGLGNRTDRPLTKRWLRSLNADNIRHLRRIQLATWTTTCLGNETGELWFWYVVGEVDLVSGGVEVETLFWENVDGHSLVPVKGNRDVLKARQSVEMIRSVLGSWAVGGVDREGIERLMESFDGVCRRRDLPLVDRSDEF